MGSINLSNEKGRDAIVGTRTVGGRQRFRYLDPEGRQVSRARILRATQDRDVNALAGEDGDLEALSQALIEDDPEVNMETYGSFLRDTSRVYVDQDDNVLHHVTEYEIILDPEGNERERRPRRITEPNVADETPLRWTGKLVPKREAFRRFVFSGKRQIIHVNGLTFDFLYDMAKQLEDADSLLLLGAGPKGNQPLVLRRGGKPYRGFLEGRTRGDRYCLVLHLSNMELKTPKPVEEPS